MLPSPAFMAPRRRLNQITTIAVTLAFIISFSISLSKSGGLGCDSGKRENMRLQVEKVKLGSRPPGCENKCLSCKPCIATLVVPPHQKRGFGPSSYDHGDFDSYYHLSWKCKCGNRLFQH